MQKLSCLVWPFSFSFGKSQRTIISRVYVIWWGRRNSLKHKLQHTDFNSREYGAQPWTSIEMDRTLDFDCNYLGVQFWLENLNNLTPTQPIYKILPPKLLFQKTKLKEVFRPNLKRSLAQLSANFDTLICHRTRQHFNDIEGYEGCNWNTIGFV